LQVVATDCLLHRAGGQYHERLATPRETCIMAAIKSPVTLLNLLKKAKKAYQKKEPEPKEEAEVRHTKIVQGLTRLRKFTAKKDGAARKPFAKEKKSVLKLMKDHFKKLKAGQKEDPNKAQLPKYLKKFTALMLAVQQLDLDALSDQEEDLDLDNLADEELSAAELDALTADEEEEEQAEEEEQEAESTTPPPLLDPKEARWITRRSIVEPRLLEALKERRGEVSQMRAIFAFAVEKAGAKEYPPALQALDRLEKLLDAAQEAGAAKEPGMDPLAPFMLRLKALMPQIQQALADGNPSGTEAKLRASEAGVFARKKDFEQANRLLDDAEKLLSGEGEEEPDEFEELYRGLLETIPEDLQRLRTVNATAAATIQKIVAGARGKAEQGDFKAAFTFLDQATKGIARAMGAARVKEAAEVIPEGKVAEMKDLFSRARTSWDATLAEARARMRPVQAQMKAEFPDAVGAVDSILDTYWQELVGVLQAGQAVRSEDDLEPAVQDALAKLQSLRAEVAGDQLFSYLESCGLKIKGVFTETFSEVETLLRG
jgi:hypothetical protein